MKRTARGTNCLKTVKQYPQTFDLLVENNKKLDEVQKSLEQYMELKRSSFPRFYFLSDDELIDILAKSKDYDVI
jgi:dynein heavy chain